MIISTGVDLVKVERIRQAIERFGDRFLRRCFVIDEITEAHRRQDPVKRFAKIFAAKEAVLKAARTGLREGMTWHDIRVGRDDKGAPFIEVSGKTKEHIDSLLPELDDRFMVHLSLSDEVEYAIAFVVISAHK